MNVMLLSGRTYCKGVLSFPYPFPLCGIPPFDHHCNNSNNKNPLRVLHDGFKLFYHQPADLDRNSCNFTFQNSSEASLALVFPSLLRNNDLLWQSTTVMRFGISLSCYFLLLQRMLPASEVAVKIQLYSDCQLDLWDWENEILYFQRVYIQGKKISLREDIFLNCHLWQLTCILLSLLPSQRNSLELRGNAKTG